MNFKGVGIYGRLSLVLAILAAMGISLTSCGDGGGAGGGVETNSAIMERALSSFASTSYQGYLDEASCTQISGWAWNANSPSSTVSVDIYDGGTKITTVSAVNYRGDLVLAGIGNGYHGYSYTPGFTDGNTHTINVYYSGTTIPLSNSPKTTAFACEGTSVSYEGYLDEASCTQISGWAWNANSPSSTVSVDIYDGGTKITTVSAGNYRGDLVLAGIGNGYHGYSYTPIFTDGKTHTINVFYSGTTIPLSNSPQTTSSACGGTAILYQGYFDEASCTLISGWAWNANSPGSEINVDIYDGSFMIATVLASNYRADLLAAGIGNGYHGYSYTPGFTDGKTHTINVYYSGTITPLNYSPMTTSTCGSKTSGTTTVSTTVITTTSVTTSAVTTTLASTTAVTTSASTTTSSIPVVVNLLPLTVNGSTCDPTLSANYINDPCVSVVFCTPGTSNCVTINSILLDTGSYGLRIFKQALNNLPLEQVASGSGSLAECIVYANGTSNWGSVQMAGVILGNEPMVQVPIQVIDPTFGTIPSSCSTAGGYTPNTQPSVPGYNGILGVGPVIQDSGQYYTCSGSTCSGTTVSSYQQVSNPVPFLPVDNNGVIIQLPAVPAAGSVSLSGSVILGIGTQANNSPSGVTAYPLNSVGQFTTTFNGSSYTSSYISTGAKALFFPSPSASSPDAGQLPNCAGANSNWFCPASTTGFSATITGASGSPSNSVSFQIGNYNSLISSANNVFNDIGGNMSGTFNWGLPFFFGRNVYIGYYGKSSSLGNGPYFAY